MKKTLLLTIIAFLCCNIYNLQAQSCIPNASACTNGAAVASFGGLCDTIIPDGQVGVLYDENIQFYIEGVCFSTSEINVSPTIDVRITELSSFTFADMPNGVAGGTNQSSYTIPQNQIVRGCGYYYGTPTEAGEFTTVVNIAADALVCAFPVSQSAAVPYEIKLRILPDASFSGLAASYCSTDPAVNLTATGNTGGTFSGPGVSGSSFDPAAAGVGSHTITYTVTAQEGAATGSTTNSSTQTVTVGSSVTYYADTDNDTYGDLNSPLTSCAPTAPAGYSVNSLDCNDNNSGINPGATDIPSNGIDEDCSGSDQTTVQDNDNDTYDNTVDCNDNDPAINPGATEICDGIDNNCDGQIDEGLTMYTYYEDTDNDGFGVSNANDITTCDSNTPAGYSTLDTDCDDADAATYPGAQEVCDGLDNNCDGQIDEGLALNTYYEDADGDGFGVDNANTTSSCFNIPPVGYSALNTDCDDTDDTIYPGATEVPNDGIDQDCDPATVAIRDVKADLNVSIYPNPTKNILNVTIAINEEMNVQLFDMNGKQVYQNNVNQNGLVIDMTALNNGVYLVKITTTNGAYTVQKVVKAN